MGFLVPIFTAVSAAVAGVSSWLGASTILAGLARFGLGLAAKYALGALLGGPKQQAQASQLNTTYGEDLARTVALGKVGTAGQLDYRNAYGSGNRTIQDAYILSNFRINRITRVRYKGEWKTLGGAEDATKGFRIQNIDAQIWVKLYKGTMTQTADAGLIARANPAGRWTSAHRGAGIAYAVVTQFLDREKLTQPWEAFFEIEGAPLYDWRKDSSVGGSGAHRWNDQSTWEFTQNPVLMAYALERGIFNGTEMMVGKNAPAARLPLDVWTLAANICDEFAGTGARYTAGLIAAAGSGVTHDQNLQPLLEACAATWVEDATGEFPIAGAAQSVVMTFTDDDIMIDEPFRFSVKRTKSELINTLAGTYLEPDNFYAQTPTAIRINGPALAEDGERLAVSVPYSAVNRSEVADRLADIAFKASRFQANGEICIHPKYLGDAKVGRWAQWNSAEYGTRKFQIVEKRLGPLGDKGARNIYLTVQEVDGSIFDPTAYVTVPVVTAPPGEPDYAVSASNFTANGIQIKVEGSTDRKTGIRFQWDAFTDVTVSAVDVEYRPEAVGVAISIGSPAVITWPNHGLAANDLFYLATTGTLPAGLAPDSPLYVKTVLTSGTFTASLTPGGAAIATTGPQSGIHSGYVDSIVKRAEMPVQVLTVSEGVLPSKTYEYRHRIITSPPRTTFFTGWSQVSTPAEVFDVSVGLAQLQADTIAFLTGMSASLQADRDKLAQLAAATLEAAGRQVEDNAVARRFRDASAAAFLELDANIDDINGVLSAQATAILGVQASVGDVSAGGLFRIRAEAGSGDVVSRLVAEVRATVGAAWVSSGFYMEAGFVGGNAAAPFSNFVINASKFVVTDGTSRGTPLTFENGTLKSLIANLGDVTAAYIHSADNAMISDYNNKYHSIAVP
ncbi:phage tail protein [Mesorhizobium sp.]|uniref:phage tail protein n=1 Tax=Mesorhizobium sp. TaxID=1871066 RepID=UPI003BA984F6